MCSVPSHYPFLHPKSSYFLVFLKTGCKRKVSSENGRQPPTVSMVWLASGGRADSRILWCRGHRPAFAVPSGRGWFSEVFCILLP